MPDCAKGWASQKTMDPGQIVPIESVVAVMMGLAVAMWRQAEAAPRPDAARTARLPALLAQAPPSKPTALGAHMDGTQRDGSPPIQGRYVLVSHSLKAANNRSAH